MVYVSDVFHKKKLDSKKINIKTIYISEGEKFERNTDGSKDDNIINGVRIKKEYYLNNELKHIESDFDTRIEYTFVENTNNNTNYTCPNCGMTAKLKEFNGGCPYCGTYYNLDYSDVDLGSKKYYDRILRNKTYRTISAIVDAVICFFIIYNVIKYTSRTFNINDYYKIFIFGTIASLLFYYAFYMFDAYFILGPVKRYKDKFNEQQKEFWKKSGLDKVTFFNNFNYEVRKYYYNKKDVIDYDVIDFDSFKDYYIKDDRYIEVEAYIRVVTFDGEFHSKFKKKIFRFKQNKNGTTKLGNGTNVMMCHNCGASIDVTKSKCDYCDSEIKYLQEWILQ